MRNKAKDRGYSLIEVLISFVIILLAVQVMTMAVIMVTKVGAKQQRGEVLEQATTLLIDKVAERRTIFQSTTKGEVMTSEAWMGEDEKLPEDYVYVCIVIEEEDWQRYQKSPLQLRYKAYYLTNEPAIVSKVSSQLLQEEYPDYVVATFGEVALEMENYIAIVVSYEKEGDDVYKEVMKRFQLI